MVIRNDASYGVRKLACAFMREAGFAQKKSGNELPHLQRKAFQGGSRLDKLGYEH
jgi:hypothetical protein